MINYYLLRNEFLRNYILLIDTKICNVEIIDESS